MIRKKTGKKRPLKSSVKTTDFPINMSLDFVPKIPPPPPPPQRFTNITIEGGENKIYIQNAWDEK